ncbi:MAG TPA: bifunctional phosphoribosylaminoimidazolecarboxamide formyltransferase/IMP cyclohydrolase, partial [Candidatus Polarisedimenticolia bacterium]|nr:bifunctional phosphoribosylaminoimidazolecarboxamide formyltransferase/IMP cyclohydrolase [Candidatus Polarisedimenticolia bacterium]
AADAYVRALAADPVSAFGGIVAFNRPVTEKAAREIASLFLEAVIAPDYLPEALEILKSKKNLRLMRTGGAPRTVPGRDYKRIVSGLLAQDRDVAPVAEAGHATHTVVTRRRPSLTEIDSLLFAWTVARHVKSNAIVYVKGTVTAGVGAGQMSRVDAVRLGASKATTSLAGSVLASDAFFPFRDGVDEAARAGVTAIIQPGGSVKDPEVIAAADEHGIAMVFTGRRHFRH